jgi:hypothetical protein
VTAAATKAATEVEKVMAMVEGSAIKVQNR